MAIKINFDTSHNAESPSFILSNRNGDRYGLIPNVRDISIKDSMSDAPEITFTVYKEDNGETCYLWDEIVDFRLVLCVEWDTWFEINLNVSDSSSVTKNVSLKRLGEAELSHIKLYGIEINTENDILRDDYTEATVLYNPGNPKASLLDRILEKAPHYYVRHVDPSIANIQRTFSFHDRTILDALNDISEEIHCLFVLSSESKANGSIDRSIDVYDMYSYCNSCGARGEFYDSCPECKSTNITSCYGEDTTVYVSKDDLGEDISLEIDADSVYNCYRIQAGDDLMTATAINCNPNGSAYIWNFSDFMKADMPQSLVAKIESYEKLCQYYQKEYKLNIPSALLSQYNSVISKYSVYNKDLKPISSIVGYPKLMEAYYDTIDLNLYLQSGLMPNAKMSDTSAMEQVGLLTASNLSPVAIANMNYLSLSSASASVLNVARILVDGRYQVKIQTSSLNGTTWTGSFVVSNHSNEEDTAVSGDVSVTITNDYSTYVQQKIGKSLSKATSSFAGDITSLFALDINSFKAELKKYCLDSLSSFNDACMACIDIMAEQGIDKPGNNMYQSLYVPYKSKLEAIQAEMQLREYEIAVVSGTYNSSAGTGIQDFLKSARNNVQNELNIQNYFGNDWELFSAYRREDLYTNDNYISDGLNNAELFSRAYEFIQVAENEVYKAANLQHTISAKLKNLLVIKGFEPLVEHFSCGNWIRIRVEDELYKLRLVDYEIDFNNLPDISVTFSDVLKISSGLPAVATIINKSSSIINSYLNDLNKINKDFEYTYDNYVSNVNGSFNDMYNDYMYSIMDTGWQAYSKIEQTDERITLEVGKTREQITVLSGELTEKTEALSSKIEMTVNTINLSVSEKITETRQYADMQATAAKDAAISSTDEKLKSYSTTVEMNSAIELTAKSINLSVNEKISETKEYANGQVSSAVTQMEGKIDITASQIRSDVSATYETKSDAGYQYTILSSAITQNADNIRLKVSKDNIISEINQSAEKISINAEKIALEGYTTINNNFSVDPSGNVTLTSGDSRTYMSNSSLRIRNSVGNICAITARSISFAKDYYDSSDYTQAIYYSDSYGIVGQFDRVHVGNDITLGNFRPLSLSYQYSTPIGVDGDFNNVTCDTLYIGTYASIFGAGSTLYIGDSSSFPSYTSFRSGVCFFPNIGTSSSEPNAVLSGGTNSLLKITASSMRYKNRIADVTEDELLPEKLYEIPVMQYRYNTDYLSDPSDRRYNRDVIGFIAEDIARIYPVAAEYDEYGRPENWNARYILPPMLALIQSLNKEVQQLKKKMEEVVC